MAESSGKRFIRRSACVPFPTPGAPTKMIRAARLSLEVVIANSFNLKKGARESKDEK